MEEITAEVEVEVREALEAEAEEERGSWRIEASPMVISSSSIETSRSSSSM